MGVTGSKWPKWGRNGPSALSKHLMYLFEARAIRNSYLIFKGQLNMYVDLQTSIEHDKHTNLIKAIKLPLSL